MSDPTPTTKTELLKSLRAELTKSNSLYDGSNRLQFVYTAVSTAVTGTACVLTTYTYVGATTQVAKVKNTYDVWDASYDI